MASSILIGRKSTLRDLFNPKINRLIQSVLNQNSISDSLVPLQNFYYRTYEEVLAPDHSLANEWFKTRIESCVEQKTIDDLVAQPFAASCVNSMELALYLTYALQSLSLYSFFYFINRVCKAVQRTRTSV